MPNPPPTHPSAVPSPRPRVSRLVRGGGGGGPGAGVPTQGNLLDRPIGRSLDVKFSQISDFRESARQGGVTRLRRGRCFWDGEMRRRGPPRSTVASAAPLPGRQLLPRDVLLSSRLLYDTCILPFQEQHEGQIDRIFIGEQARKCAECRCQLLCVSAQATILGSQAVPNSNSRSRCLISQPHIFFWGDSKAWRHSSPGGGRMVADLGSATEEMLFLGGAFLLSPTVMLPQTDICDLSRTFKTACFSWTAFGNTPLGFCITPVSTCTSDPSRLVGWGTCPGTEWVGVSAGPGTPERWAWRQPLTQDPLLDLSSATAEGFFPWAAFLVYDPCNRRSSMRGGATQSSGRDWPGDERCSIFRFWFSCRRHLQPHRRPSAKNGVWGERPNVLVRTRSRVTGAIHGAQTSCLPTTRPVSRTSSACQGCLEKTESCTRYQSSAE